MAWYNTSWLDRVKVTVDHTKVGANQTNFPVYVDLSNLPAGFFTGVRTDGGDIRITQSDGTTELAREVVAIDTTAKTGELHFNGNSLSSTVDTVFYIYYGNASATEPAANATYGKYNVWDSNYVGVYHLEANGNDSTSLQNTLTAGGTVSYSAQKLGQGVNLGSGAGYLSQNADPGIGTGAFTIEAWCYITSVANALAIANYAAGASGVFSRFDWYQPGGYWQIYRVKNGIAQQGPTYTQTPSLNTWYYMVETYDTTNVNGYQNGSLVGGPTAASGNGSVAQAVTQTIGSDAQSPTSPGWWGAQDEVRFSKIARSSTWLSTQYNNQNSPSTFYSVGAQEVLAALGGTLSLMGVG